VFLFYASKLGENPTHETVLNLHFEKNLRSTIFDVQLRHQLVGPPEMAPKMEGQKKTGEISRT